MKEKSNRRYYKKIILSAIYFTIALAAACPLGAQTSIYDYKGLINPGANYGHMLNRVDSLRTFFAKEYSLSRSPEDRERIIVDSGVYLSKSIVDDLMPYWVSVSFYQKNLPYNRKSPYSDDISFIINLLLDARFNISSSVPLNTPNIILKKLSDPNPIYRFESLEEFSYFCLKAGDGIYIASHRNKLFFVSNEQKIIYIYRMDEASNNSSITKSLLAEDAWFESQGNYFVIQLSTNRTLIEKWLAAKDIF